MSQKCGPRRVPARTAQEPIQKVLTRLPGHRATGKGWTARCPAHDDQTASLSIGQGDDGRVLMHCHAGCSTKAVCLALGITVASLFVNNAVTKKRSELPRTTGRIVAEYDYRNERGELLYQAVRYHPKTFRQRRPDGRGGWIRNIDGIHRVLYRLPELFATSHDAWVYIPDGEKDVDRLASQSLVSTTNSGGAGKWHLTDTSPLYGRRICILPDNDEAGRKHRDDILHDLFGKAAELRVLELPDLPPKGDVSDWLDAGNTVAELTELLETQPPIKVLVREESRVSTSHRAVIVRASEVTPRKHSWLWRYRIPRRKTTSISGPPDVGKSTLTHYLAACVSAGHPWPDLPDEPPSPGGVVIISAEDDADDTIVPRLIAAGADLDRVNILDGTEFIDSEGNKETRAFNLEQLDPLEDAVVRTPDCRLVILDPGPAYLGSVDSHKNAEVRAVLAPLARLATQFNLAIVMTNHFSKGDIGPAINRTMGSLAFIAAPRAAWICVHDKLDRTRRLFLPQKLNIANHPTGLAYRLVPSETDPEIPALEWDEGPVTITADEALAEEPKSPRAVRVMEAVGWLKDLLSNGPLPQATVEAAAKKGDLAWRTVERAKSGLRIQSDKEETGWIWSLPTVSIDTPDAADQECHVDSVGDVGGLGGLKRPTNPVSPEVRVLRIELSKSKRAKTRNPNKKQKQRKSKRNASVSHGGATGVGVPDLTDGASRS